VTGTSYSLVRCLQLYFQAFGALQASGQHGHSDGAFQPQCLSSSIISDHGRIQKQSKIFINLVLKNRRKLFVYGDFFRRGKSLQPLLLSSLLL
jgi:hypothetical protein